MTVANNTHERSTFEVIRQMADANGAARTTSYVNLSHYRQAALAYITATVANAANITLLQAKDKNGTDSKALGFGVRYVKTIAGDKYVKTAVAANTFSTGTTDNNINLLYVDSSDLDEGFTHVAVHISNPGGAHNSAVVAAISGYRYGGELADFPSPLA